MEITAKIDKIFSNGSTLRAVASLTIDGCFVVHDLKIIDSAKGMFVAMPNEKINDKYKDICHPISNEARQKIIDVVMEAYEQFQAKSSQ
jgi:stage V sporulation protein G